MFLQRNLGLYRTLADFCLEVTAPKPVSLPTGPSELHRNSICCHWARRIAPKPVSLPTRLGPRMFFWTSGRAVWPSSSPCRLVALRHLAPAPSRPSRSCTARCGRPAFASTLRTRRPLIPAAEEPLAPRVAGAAGLAGYGRRGRPRAPAPSRRCVLSSRTEQKGHWELSRVRTRCAHRF